MTSVQLHALTRGMTIRQVNAELGEPTAQMTRGNRTVNFYSNGQRLNFINGILDSIEGDEVTEQPLLPESPIQQNNSAKKAPSQSSTASEPASPKGNAREKKTTFSFTESSDLNNKRTVYYFFGSAIGLLLLLLIIKQQS